MDFQANGTVHTPPSNTAWRCRMFVMGVLPHSHASVDAAFAQSLGIVNYDSTNADQQDLVRAAIRSLRRQQQALLVTLEEKNVHPDLCAPIAASNHALASMSNIQQPLTNFSQFLSAENALALGWAAQVLPSSTLSVNSLETAEVLNDIIALKARLTSMRFPAAVHSLLEQLLKDLEEGIVTASFEGNVALERACRHAISEVASAESHLREVAPSLNVEQRSYLTEAAEKFEKVGKIAGGVTSVIGLAQKLVPMLFG